MDKVYYLLYKQWQSGSRHVVHVAESQKDIIKEMQARQAACPEDDHSLYYYVTFCNDSRPST